MFALLETGGLLSISTTLYEGIFHTKFWRLKLQSWNITRESCAICFRTKKGRVKCWWNWLLGNCPSRHVLATSLTFGYPHYVSNSFSKILIKTRPSCIHFYFWIDDPLINWLKNTFRSSLCLNLGLKHITRPQIISNFVTFEVILVLCKSMFVNGKIVEPSESLKIGKLQLWKSELN